MTGIMITLRMPRDLVEKLDKLAAEETYRVGVPIDRSKIIRRTLKNGLAALEYKPLVEDGNRSK